MRGNELIKIFHRFQLPPLFFRYISHENKASCLYATHSYKVLGTIQYFQNVTNEQIVYIIRYQSCKTFYFRHNWLVMQDKIYKRIKLKGWINLQICSVHMPIMKTVKNGFGANAKTAFVGQPHLGVFIVQKDLV